MPSRSKQLPWIDGLGRSLSFLWVSGDRVADRAYAIQSLSGEMMNSRGLT